MREKILNPTKSSDGYLSVNLYKNGNRDRKRIHQLVGEAFFNVKSNGKDIVIHHINNNKSDNNVVNLEVTTQRDNCITHAKKTSKYRGVCWCKQIKRWKAQLMVNGKIEYLGVFKNEEEAYAVYLKRLKEVGL